MKNTIIDEIEILLNEFKSEAPDDGKFEDTHNRITLVLPNDYKQRYDEAQNAKNKRVSKLMVKIAMKVIDSVNPKG